MTFSCFWLITALKVCRYDAIGKYYTLIPSPVMRGEGRGRSEAPGDDGERSRRRARLSWTPRARRARSVRSSRLRSLFLIILCSTRRFDVVVASPGDKWRVLPWPSLNSGSRDRRCILGVSTPRPFLAPPPGPQPLFASYSVCLSALLVSGLLCLFPLVSS